MQPLSTVVASILCLALATPPDQNRLDSLDLPTEAEEAEEEAELAELAEQVQQAELAARSEAEAEAAGFSDLPPSASAERNARESVAAATRSRRSVVTGGVLLGLGLAVGLAGIVTMIVWSRLDDASTTAGPTDPIGPNCTTGKPCGNTCIEASDTCHTATYGSSPTAYPGLLAGGLLMTLAGTGSTIAGAVVLMNSPRARIVAAPGRLTIRF
jgi:hypothetical protein